MGTLKLLKHVSVEDAANSIEHTLDSVPHPSLPQPAKPRSFKVDPRDRDMCLKLSGGVVNQQLLECMQESQVTVDGVTSPIAGRVTTIGALDSTTGTTTTFPVAPRDASSSTAHPHGATTTISAPRRFY